MFHNCDKTTVNEFMMAGKWGRCNWKEYGGGEKGRGALWIIFSWQTISLVTLVPFSVRKRHSQLDILYDPTQISIVHLFPSRIWTFFYLKGHTRMARWLSHWTIYYLSRGPRIHNEWFTTTCHSSSRRLMPLASAGTALLWIYVRVIT